MTLCIYGPEFVVPLWGFLCCVAFLISLICGLLQPDEFDKWIILGTIFLSTILIVLSIIVLYIHWFVFNILLA